MGNTVEKKLEYDDVNFETGDILLFSGKGGMSGLVKCATFSQWSHVGIVLKLQNSEKYQFKKGSEDNLYLFHSYNREFELDVLSGEFKSGVQLNVLKDALIKYRKDGGTTFVRHAPSSMLDQFRKTVNGREFMEWMIYNSPKDYEQSYYSLASSQIDCFCLPCFQNRGDDSSYFCSELVRDVLSRLGTKKLRLQLGEYPDEFTPVDLSSDAYGFFCEPKVDLTELGWKEEIEVVFKNHKRKR